MLSLFVLYDVPQLVPFVLQKKPNLPSQKSSIGLTPIEIAQFLDRKNFFPSSKNKISWSEFLSVPGDISYLGRLEYLPHLVFEDLATFQEALTFYHHVYDVEFQRSWLASFYEKEIREGFFIPATLQRVNSEIGFGLYSSLNVLEGGFIGTCTGVVRKRNRKMRDNPYCFQYAFSDLSIDARDRGNLTRFINHSFSPNVELISVLTPPLFQMIYVAKKPIAKGEEILADYGKNYWKDLRKTPKSI
ncbi:MAG: SET domain-containing protein-lysine N-methyltransferase [Chlamydiota bacterium]